MRQNKILLLTFFITVWMIPLFFPTATLIRYAFEELRVLVTGIYIGYLFMEKKESEKNGEKERVKADL